MPGFFLWLNQPKSNIGLGSSASERVFDTEDHASVPPVVRVLAKKRTIQVIHRNTIVILIEGVEKVGPQNQLLAFQYSDALLQAKVVVPESRRAERILAKVAVTETIL